MFFYRLRLIRLQKYPAVIFSAVLVLLFYFPSYSTDYNFSEISVAEFPPAANKFMKQQVIDIDNDGLDELIIMFRYNYYIYSFDRDSILFSDTAADMYFSGFMVTDYNGDLISDILILGADVRQQSIYFLDGTLSDSLQFVVSVGGMFEADNHPSGNLYYGDIDLDGEEEIIVTRLKEYFIFYDYLWNLEFYFKGYTISLSTSDWSMAWRQLYPSAEHATFADLNGDGTIESIIWGLYYHYDRYKVYGPPDYVEEDITSYQEFGVISDSGDMLLAINHPNPATVLGGPFNSVTGGDDIIIFKDGATFDTTVFAPSGSYGIYCLGMPGDSIQLLWGIDAESAQNYLFTLPSLPGMFCASTANNQYTIISGKDGQTIGTVDGLRRLSITEEGHFLPLPDTVIQVIQIDGNKVYLYQQTSPTDISEPIADIIPEEYYLGQNFPNPFNPTTSIEYALPSRSQVTISVYNLLGQKISTIVDEVKSPGAHSAVWDGRDSDGNEVASGIYFYQIRAGDFVESKKMLLLK